MFARTQQISSPLLVPLIGSILTTGVLACAFLLPPTRPVFTMRQMVLHAALDLVLVACVHTVTVWSIWRLLQEYLEPSAGVLALHIWAAVAWLPLLTTLSAEHSLWISCFVPWAFANALIFLNLWTALQDDLPAEPASAPPLFYVAPTPPLWRTLLPYAITVLTLQVGLTLLLSRRPWSAAALFCASLLLFLIRHPAVSPTPQNRRRFSRSSILQTACVFFLLTTALTPFLQQAYGLRHLAVLLARVPTHSVSAPTLAGLRADYSGVILTLPPRPHPHLLLPPRSTADGTSATLTKPLMLPFDGVYWYFQQPDTRPRHDAHTQRGDPIKNSIRSSDQMPIAMEAHQRLADSLDASCCRALRLDLLNGDDRQGVIRVEVLLRDTDTGKHSTVSLGTLPIRSSQLQNIPLDRAPVSESLRFAFPPESRGRRFNEIVVRIKPSSERALAGARVSLQDFVLQP